MFEFKLPDLGEGVHEGEILHWYVKSGDDIKEDDPLVEVETDKAAVTIPSPKGGKVVSTSGGIGEVIKVGTVLVVIDENGNGKAVAQQSHATAMHDASVTTMESVAGKPIAFEAPPPSIQAVTPLEQSPAASNASGPIPAAPATRRIARELGIDLHEVPPSGPGGRVTTEDVQRYAETRRRGSETPMKMATPVSTVTLPLPSMAAKATPAMNDTVESSTTSVITQAGVPYLQVEPLADFREWGPVETEPVRSIRKKIAHKMVTSMTIVPHVAHMDEADVTELDAFRRRDNEQGAAEGRAKLSLMPYVIKAVVSELKRAPKFNASLDPFKQEIVYKKYYNIGFAADTERGLVVPVIPQADTKSIRTLGNDLATLAEKARACSLDVSNLRGGTFTITNVGSLGGTGVLPTINYPEVAILGLGKAHEKPVVRGGKIVVRLILPMTLAFDHRVIDGAEAARFVTALIRKLSEPNVLFLES